LSPTLDVVNPLGVEPRQRRLKGVYSTFELGIRSWVWRESNPSCLPVKSRVAHLAPADPFVSRVGFEPTSSALQAEAITRFANRTFWMGR
jgi:hypothetical protein